MNNRLSRILMTPLKSPLLITTAVFVLMLYYLSWVMPGEFVFASFAVFTFFAISYLILAVILGFIFRQIINSMSLKLTAFFLTTAVIPVLMLILLAVLYLGFLVGVSESYVFMRVIRYQYHQKMDHNPLDVKFATREGSLCFMNDVGDKVELEDSFFDLIHELTGTNYQTTVVRVSNLVDLEGNPVPADKVGSEDVEWNSEDVQKKVFVKIYSTEKETEEITEGKFIIEGTTINYPIVYPLEGGGERDNVIFLLKIDLKRFGTSLFSGESSFATVNRYILFLLLAVSLSFLAFQLYLLIKGMFFVGGITSSTRKLVTGVEEIRKGNFDYRVTGVTDEQLGRVAGAFNSMASDIQSLFQEKVQREQMTQEMEIARRIQSSVLLQGIFGEEHYRVAVHSRASRVVGGDYCNFYKKETGLEVLAGDVSGKGLGAAMYVSEVDGLFYGLAARREPLEIIVEGLHKFFLDRGAGTQFFSATLLDIDPERDTISYFRMGDPPLMVRKEGNWIMLRPKGMIAGMRGVDEILPHLEKVELPLSEVEGLFLYSDGFLELFPETHVEIMETIRKLDLSNLESCHEVLTETVTERSRERELQDDVTFALISFLK